MRLDTNINDGIKLYFRGTSFGNKTQVVARIEIQRMVVIALDAQEEQEV